MQATFTDEQEQLVELATRLAERIRHDADAGADAGAGWPLLAESGLVGLRLPTAVGGGATSAVEVAIVAEALGRHVAPTPFIGPVLAAELLAAVGAPDELLATVAGGQGRLSVALDRSLSGLGLMGGGVGGSGVGGSGVGGSGVVGSGVVGSGVVGSGVVGWDAHGAESLVGLVHEPDGTRRVALSPRDGAVLAAGDFTRESVAASGTPANPVGRPLDDAACIRWEALALVLLCADMVGAMAGALELAVDYATHREQFGQPIGSFQALQHLAADQHVSTESSRSATYYAAWALDGLAPHEALAAARVAKAYVAPLAREVLEAVLQIHGGIGHTWEHIAHHYLRRVLLDRRTLGDESVQLGHIADKVLAEERQSR
jgi:alkylation response protein AidB-like acyl-CoA dehydrogenase